MYAISDLFNGRGFNQLEIRKLHKTDAFEVLNINLEKGYTFPEHTSPTDALLIVLQGAIFFHINVETYDLKEGQHFNFPGKTKHWVEAAVNSRFLIIR